MFKYNGKEVLTLKFRPAICDKSALSNIWEPYDGNAFLLYGAQTIIDKFNSLKTKLQHNSALWFAKPCKFPRFKIQDSGFTRTIKPSKSNFTVWSPINDLIDDRITRTVLEDKFYIYLVNPNHSYVSSDTPRSAREDFLRNPVKYLIDNGLYYGDVVNTIYSGPITRCNQATWEDLTKLMNGEITNIVMADDLDKEITQKFESLDLETLDSISDMLSSSDWSTVDLGLKLLSGYNVMEYPGTIRFLLGTKYRKVERSPAWKSVAVQQMIKTINYTGYIEIPNRMWNLQIDKCTEKDKEFLKPILVKETKRFLDKILEGYGIKDLEPLGVKVNYEVE